MYFGPQVLAIATIVSMFIVVQTETRGAEPLRPTRLRCHHLEEPRGIDIRQPRMSWIVESAERDERQTAFQLVVGTDRDAVARGEGDLWDTDKVASDETLDHKYDGRPLASHQRVHWSVRVWNKSGVESSWARPASFSTGFLLPDAWTAPWIGFDAARDHTKAPAALFDAKWIMFAQDTTGDAPEGTRSYGTTLAVPSAPIAHAELYVTADDEFTFFINGQEVAKQSGPDSWRKVQAKDVTSAVKPGENEFRAQVVNSSRGPTGLIAKLFVTLVDGRVLKTATAESWYATDRTDAQAIKPGSLEVWPTAKAVGGYDAAPWHEITSQVMYLPPTILLRTNFSSLKRVRRATLYATALGIADVRINGQLVADEYFNPGWTDYAKRVYYRAYDVTDRIKHGENALGAELADGWFGGYISFMGQRDQYGVRSRFAAELQIEYADGTTKRIATGQDWRTRTGPTRQADFLMGETYDARLADPAWSTPSFDDRDWQKVDVGTTEVDPAVSWHPAQPVEAFEEFRAVKVTELTPGAYVLDLGQNFAGVARLKLKNTTPGQAIQLRFAERLNPDGTIYTTNLRSARSTDTYICRGDSEEIWTPRFTFHGFQYVEVTGLTSPPAPDTVVGIALSSATPVVGKFETSDPMLNRLHKNIYYTQRANFVDIPTDCPQRDERLGWTADAQVYVEAAALNADVQAFFTKWLVDLTDAQRADGQFPMVAPLPKNAGVRDDGGPAWADAGAIIPWSLYEIYGDKQLLARQYPSMRRFIEFNRQRFGDDFLPPEEFHSFGDWLSIGATTPHDVFYTAQFARSTKLTAETAEALGKAGDARELNAIFEQIKSAFNRAYVSPDGKIKGDTQTCYVMALAIGLLDEHPQQRAADYLVADIENRGWHLSTGFIGTKDLLPVLTKIGRTDVAYHLLHNETFPSWGFSIRHGATSIWERWDGWTPEKGFQDPAMNSFAHYSFGAVYTWMVANIGGIASDAPGWKQITIAPKLDPRLDHAKVEYDSIRGRIATELKKDGPRLRLMVTIPANVTATVQLPTDDLESVTESGKALSPATPRLSLGSGVYHFQMILTP
jgi:alpha-L-rhamnosidase